MFWTINKSLIFIILFLSCSQKKEAVEIIYFQSNKNYVQGVKHNNKKSGLWIEYNENKEIESIYTYENDVLNGEFYVFWNDSTLFRHGYFHNGKKDGQYFQYSDNGNLAWEGMYKNDKKVSIWNEYTYEGKLNRITFYDKYENKKIIKDFKLLPPTPNE